LFAVSYIKYENSHVKLVALSNIPKLLVAGEEIGPFAANTEFEVRVWVADELVNAGLARRLEEEPLELMELQKAHFRETMQTSYRLSKLPRDFYPRLKRFLKDLKRASRSAPEKVAELQKASQLATDILTCRLNKILTLTSITDKSEAILQNLTPEERALHEVLYDEVERWRSDVYPQ